MMPTLSLAAGKHAKHLKTASKCIDALKLAEACACLTAAMWGQIADGSDRLDEGYAAEEGAGSAGQLWKTIHDTQGMKAVRELQLSLLCEARDQLSVYASEVVATGQLFDNTQDGSDESTTTSSDESAKAEEDSASRARFHRSQTLDAGQATSTTPTAHSPSTTAKARHAAKSSTEPSPTEKRAHTADDSDDAAGDDAGSKRVAADN